MAETYDCNEEWFGCICHDSEHVIKISYHIEDEEFYLYHPIRQFRTSIFPCIFDRYIVEDIFTKEFWTTYYYNSVWERFSIAWKYFFTDFNPDGGVFGTVVFKNQDLQRILNICLKYSTNQNSIDRYIQSVNCGVLFEIENDYYRLQIVKEDLNTKLNTDNIYTNHLSTQIQLKRKYRFKKIIEAIYFAFGGSGANGYKDLFVIDKTGAKIMHSVITKFMKDEKIDE